MGVACGTHGRGEKCIQNFVENPERKTPFGTPRRIREDNIRMDLGEIG
jgi:hypothetical protein